MPILTQYAFQRFFPNSGFFPKVIVLILVITTETAQAQTSSLSTAIHSPIVIVLAMGLLIINLVISAYLYRLHKKLSTKITARKSTLNPQGLASQGHTTTHDDKLYNINNQLYEEIAKHEITEELLKETQDYLQNIINSMPSILIGVSRTGVVTHWNAAAQHEYSISSQEALGTPLERISPNLELSRQLVENAITQQKPQKREGLQEGHGSQARYKDITIYPLNATEIDGAVIRIDDSTSRIHLENMIIQNEKMGSLGELAAGVAHEINNPLGTIIQSVQNIQRRLSNTLAANINAAEKRQLSLENINLYLEDRKITAFLSNIKEAGERAAAITTNMLEFSRAHTHQHKPLDLIELLNRSIDLAVSSNTINQQQAAATVNIIRHFPTQNQLVDGSATEIQQVILNLINNAYHAFNKAQQQATSTDTAQSLEIQLSLSFSDSHAIIKVRDNGPGMDEWTQRHIFDPFFTTKEAGEGTGLGLSVSYFIITKHHDGEIKVESALEKGTSFIIHLPIKATDPSYE